MKSYEELLQLMLAQVPNDIDKRSGSVILAALAPVAAMLAEQQCYLDNVMNATMPDTARGENLTRKCAELGVVRHKATNAVRKAIFTGAPVPIGSRFGADGIIYEVILKISASEYQVKCQQTGAIGNSYFGALLPIDIISDLETQKRWENMLLLPHNPALTLEERRMQLLSRLQMQPDITLLKLAALLKQMTNGGATAALENDKYILKVRVALTSRYSFNNVNSLLHDVVPANIVIDLSLLYNKNETFEYIMQSISGDIKSNIMSMTISKFYPLYPK